MFLYFLVSPIVYFPHKHIFILPTDLTPCVLFCHTLLGSPTHLCNFICTNLIRFINQLCKTPRLSAPIQSTIFRDFFIETNVNQQIQIRAAQSLNQRWIRAANCVAVKIRIGILSNLLQQLLIDPLPRWVLPHHR